MAVILPALKSNYLIFDILSFTDCVKAYIIMRSLSKKANSKINLLCDFVVPHKISDCRLLLEKLAKLAEIQTLKFPIIIDYHFETESFVRILDIYPNSSVKILIKRKSLIQKF